MNEAELKEALRPDYHGLFEYLELLYLQVLDGDVRRIDVTYADRRLSVYRVGNYIRIDIIPNKKEELP